MVSLSTAALGLLKDLVALNAGAGIVAIQQKGLVISTKGNPMKAPTSTFASTFSTNIAFMMLIPTSKSFLISIESPFIESFILLATLMGLPLAPITAELRIT